MIIQQYILFRTSASVHPRLCKVYVHRRYIAHRVAGRTRRSAVLRRTAVIAGTCVLGLYGAVSLLRPPFLLYLRRRRGQERIADGGSGPGEAKGAKRQEKNGTAVGTADALSLPKLHVLSACSTAARLWHHHGHAPLHACLAALLGTPEGPAWAVNHGALRVLPWLLQQAGRTSPSNRLYASILSSVLSDIKEGLLQVQTGEGVLTGRMQEGQLPQYAQEVAVLDAIPADGWSVITSSNALDADTDSAHASVSALHESILHGLLLPDGSTEDPPHLPQGLRQPHDRLETAILDRLLHTTAEATQRPGKHDASTEVLHALLLRAMCHWTKQGIHNQSLVDRVSTQSKAELAACVTDMLSKSTIDYPPSSPTLRAFMRERARAATVSTQSLLSRSVLLAAALVRQEQQPVDDHADSDAHFYANMLSKVSAGDAATEHPEQPLFSVCLQLQVLKLASQARLWDSTALGSTTRSLLPQLLTVWCSMHPHARQAVYHPHATPMLHGQVPMPTGLEWAAALLVEGDESNHASHVLRLAAPAMRVATAAHTGHMPADSEAVGGSAADARTGTGGGAGQRGRWLWGWDWRGSVAQGAQRVAALTPSLRRLSFTSVDSDTLPSLHPDDRRQELVLLSTPVGEPDKGQQRHSNPAHVVQDVLREGGQIADPDEGLPITIREVRRRQLAAAYEPLLQPHMSQGQGQWEGIPVLTLLASPGDGHDPAWPLDLQACPRYTHALPSMADVLLACLRKDGPAYVQGIALSHLRSLLALPTLQEEDTSKHQVRIAQAWLAEGLQSLLAFSFPACDELHAQQLRISIATEASRWFLRELEASTSIVGRDRSREMLPAYILDLGRKEVQRAAAVGMLPAIQSELFLPRTVPSLAFQLHAMKAMAYACSGTAPCRQGNSTVLSARQCGQDVSRALQHQHMSVPVTFLAHHYGQGHGQDTRKGVGTMDVAVMRQCMRLLANLSQWGPITEPESLPAVLRTCLHHESTDAKLRGQAARAAVNMSLPWKTAEPVTILPSPPAKYTYGDFLMPLYDEGSAVRAVQGHEGLHMQGEVKRTGSLDIVLVHGLQGASLKTWRTPVDPIVWLQEHGESERPPGSPSAGLLTERTGSVSKHGRHMGLWPLLWLVPDIQDTQADGQQESAQVRVIAVQYDADMLSSASIRPPLDLPQVAEQLAIQLHAAGVGSEGRQTVFICHSLGGIVTKQLLARTALGTSSLLPSTMGVVFYATPHKGSKMAETWVWATGAGSGGVDREGQGTARQGAEMDGTGRRWLPSLWSSAPSVSTPSGAGATPAAQMIRRGTLSSHINHLGDVPALLALDKDFQEAISRTRSGTRCLSLGEGGPTALRSAVSFTGPGSDTLGLTIVPPASADPGYGDFLVVPGTDHVDICKPECKHGDARYEAALHFILRARGHRQRQGEGGGST